MKNRVLKITCNFVLMIYEIAANAPLKMQQSSGAAQMQSKQSSVVNASERGSKKMSNEFQSSLFYHHHECDVKREIRIVS